jgi:hypothetical protein
MKKKITIFLVLTMVIFIIACGESNNNTGDGNGNDSAASLIPDNGGSVENNNNADPDIPVNGNTGGSNDDNSGDNTPSTDDSQQNLGINNIADLNQSLTISAANRFGENQHTATISVVNVYRGEDARLYINARMDEADMIMRADLVEDNEEDYLLVQFSFTLVSAEDGDTINSLLMVAYNEEFEPYPNIITAGLYNAETLPQLSKIDVSVGETVVGYWFYIIDKDDANPVVAYANRLMDNSDGAWFRLT